MSKRRPRKLQTIVNRFNREFPVGTPVYLKKDFGAGELETVVSQPAFVLEGHSAVAFFEDVNGAFSIQDNRVRAVPGGVNLLRQ